MSQTEEYTSAELEAFAFPDKPALLDKVLVAIANGAMPPSADILEIPDDVDVKTLPKTMDHFLHFSFERLPDGKVRRIFTNSSV